MDIIINSTLPHLLENVPKADESSHLSNYYQNILACLGYSANNPPVADLLRRYHKLEGLWLIASPIHWEATHNDAMIMACDDALDLSEEESQHLFADLAEFLADDKVKLHYHDAYTWLIQFEAFSPVNAKPVHMLLQQPMMQQLQALDSTLFWSKFLTENQMFFSEHPLNKARVGLHSINGVWIWGAGELKARVSKPMICSDEATYDLASVLSTRVNRYVPDHKYPKDAVLLFSDFDGKQACQFEKNTVHWYWNNAKYITKPKNWFARLFGGK